MLFDQITSDNAEARLPNNAAGKIMDFVTACEAVPSSRKPGPLFSILPEILGMSRPIARPQLAKICAEILELPNKVVEEIHSIHQLDHKLYISWVSNVQNVWSTNNFELSITRLLEPFDLNCRSLAKICNDLLSRNLPEQGIDRLSGRKLLENTRSLIEDTKKSDLDSQIKNFVLRHLLIVEQSILESQFVGISAFQRGLEVSVGVAKLQAKELERTKETEIGKRLIAILTTFMLISNTIHNFKQLPQDLIGVYGLIEGDVKATDAEGSQDRAGVKFQSNQNTNDHR